MTNDEELPPGTEHRLHMRCEYKYLDSKDEANYCSEKFIEGTLAVGELCLLRPQQVNPTQPSIGKGMQSFFLHTPKFRTCCSVFFTLKVMMSYLRPQIEWVCHLVLCFLFFEG